MSSNAVHTAIARLFARGSAVPNADVLGRYEAALATFGTEFAPAKAGDPQRYADSLIAAGRLEKRVVTLHFGCRFEYRRVELAELAA